MEKLVNIVSTVTDASYGIERQTYVDRSGRQMGNLAALLKGATRHLRRQ